MTPDYAVLLMPYPPTSNNLFAGSGRRRFISKKYHEWRTEASRALAAQAPLPEFEGPVSVRYAYGRPDKRRRDLGNLEKSVSDQLVSAGVIVDDC